MLRSTAGWIVNDKRVERIWRREGLKVPAKQPKRGRLWLMLGVRDAIPKSRDLAKAEFSTLRLRLIKIAARVIETTSRVRLAFSAYHPEATLFARLPGDLAALGP